MTTTAYDDQLAECTPEEEEAFKAIEARQQESTAESAKQPSQQERFESVCGYFPYCMNLDQWPDGGYRDADTKRAWATWQAACPEGWQAVPKKPTHNMLEASGYDVSIEAVEAWQAMLSAAPKPEDV